jgi:cardiolipin synthase
MFARRYGTRAYNSQRYRRCASGAPAGNAGPILRPVDGPMLKINKRMLWGLLIGAAVAIVLTLLVLNFMGPEKQIERQVTHKYDIDDPQFRRELGTLLGPAIIDGNHVDHLENGIEIFPSMLEAIAGAQETITFETYIYWSGEVGKKFADALSERARAGVKVHVLLDWAGSQKMEDALVEQLKAAGAQVEIYHPLHWYNLGRLNNRTHRKLLVIDGKVGFTGGVGIADPWDGDAQDKDHWRDSHFRVEGPVVAQMQAAFMDNWIKTTGVVLTGAGYFPALKKAGTQPAQMFTSSPSGGSESMHLMYLLALSAANDTIDLASAYFVPDKLTERALLEALDRGVRLRILVPGDYTDSDLVKHASRAMWGELLSRGATIHRYSPAMFHTKMLVVDQRLVSVGSTNFDPRSFRLNDEASLNVYDHGLAEAMTEVFENDLADSKPYTFEEWRQRPWREKLQERFAVIFKSQM